MFELTGQEWALVIACAFVVGLMKAGLAGLSMAVIPVMAGIFPAKSSTGILLPLLIVGDAFAVTYYRRHARWPILMRLLPAAVIGIVIGFFLMNQISDAGMRRVLGVGILVLIGFTLVRGSRFLPDEKIPTGWGMAAAAGVAAGVTTMMANAAGPIMMVYLLAMKYRKNEFIGTMSWFFMVVNWIKVPFSVKLGLITSDSLRFDLKLAPVVLLGAVAGVWIVRHLSNQAYTRWVQIVTVILALRLVLLTPGQGSADSEEAPPPSLPALSDPSAPSDPSDLSDLSAPSALSDLSDPSAPSD